MTVIKLQSAESFCTDVNKSEEGVYRALCVKAGKKRRQCPYRRTGAARFFREKCSFWRGCRRGGLNPLQYDIFFSFCALPFLRRGIYSCWRQNLVKTCLHNEVTTFVRRHSCTYRREDHAHHLCPASAHARGTPAARHGADRIRSAAPGPPMVAPLPAEGQRAAARRGR